jgi:hypothetical protein
MLDVALMFARLPQLAVFSLNAQSQHSHQLTPDQPYLCAAIK